MVYSGLPHYPCIIRCHSRSQAKLFELSRNPQFPWIPALQLQGPAFNGFIETTFVGNEQEKKEYRNPMIGSDPAGFKLLWFWTLLGTLIPTDSYLVWKYSPTNYFYLSMLIIPHLMKYLCSLVERSQLLFVCLANFVVSMSKAIPKSVNQNPMSTHY